MKKKQLPLIIIPLFLILCCCKKKKNPPIETGVKRYTKNVKGIQYWHGIHHFLDSSGIHTGVHIRDTFTIDIINDSTIYIRGTKLYYSPDLNMDSNKYIVFSTKPNSVLPEETIYYKYKVDSISYLKWWGNYEYYHLFTP